MVESQEEIKLFAIKGFFRNSGFSRMSNYGDDYGEAYPFTEYAVAKSQEEAKTQIKDGFEERIKRHKEVVETAKQIEKERGKTLSDLEIMGLGVVPFPPSVPCKLEEWKAKEITIPGYRITLEKIPQEAS